MPEELWVEIHNFVQEVVIKTIPWKKKCKKAKWLCEEALQIEKRKVKRQRRKGKIYPFEGRIPKNSKESKNAFFSDQCKQKKKKKGRRNKKWKRLEILQEN